MDSDATPEQYTVRLGDTLWSIAERFYGHGTLWVRIAEHNPLAAAGVLYEGQSLELPPPPEPDAPARRPALALRHAPVRVRFDGRQPLFRYVGFGVGGVGGFAGALVFSRGGALFLGELTPGRLLHYRIEQIAWAVDLFQEHVCGPALRTDWPLFTSRSAVGPRITLRPFEVEGPGYTISGQLAEWQQVSVHRGLVDGPPSYSKMLTVNPAALFRTASLLLSDAEALADGLAEWTIPLGRVLRAACPHLIPPSTLWQLAPDKNFHWPPSGPATQPALDLPPLDGASPPRRAGRTEPVEEQGEHRTDRGGEG